jgi:hypothetical protein
VTIDESGRATCVTPYDPDFVAALKTSVPPRYRRWDPTTQCWTVTEPFKDTALELGRRH